MRQLANASTRIAINKHERRRRLQLVFAQMTTAWVALVISIVVLQWVSQGIVGPFVIAVTELVAAAFLGLKAAIDLRQIVIQTRRDPDVAHRFHGSGRSTRACLHDHRRRARRTPAPVNR